MLNDLRYALRTLRLNRFFAAMAILSLALGIGANTAIYSFMDAILVRTLPVHDPDSLVVLKWHAKGRSAVVQSVNGSMYNDPALGGSARISPIARLNSSAREIRCSRPSWPSTAPTGSLH